MKKFLIAVVLLLSANLPSFASDACSGVWSVDERRVQISALGGTQEAYTGALMEELIKYVGGENQVGMDLIIATTVPTGDMALLMGFKNGCQVAQARVPKELYLSFVEKHTAGSATNG